MLGGYKSEGEREFRATRLELRNYYTMPRYHWIDLKEGTPVQLSSWRHGTQPHTWVSTLNNIFIEGCKPQVTISFAPTTTKAFCFGIGVTRYPGTNHWGIFIIPTKNLSFSFCFFCFFCHTHYTTQLTLEFGLADTVSWWLVVPAKAPQLLVRIIPDTGCVSHGYAVRLCHTVLGFNWKSRSTDSKRKRFRD